MSTSKQSDGVKKKGIWEITLRIVIIFREACDLECMFVVFVFVCRAEVRGCAAQSGCTGPPGLPKCIKLDDWQWLKPHRAWGNLRRSAVSLLLQLVWRVFYFFLKGIFVCHTNATQCSRLEQCSEGLLLAVRQDATQWFLRGWTNAVASSNMLGTAAEEAGANNPESSEVCQ